MMPTPNIGAVYKLDRLTGAVYFCVVQRGCDEMKKPVPPKLDFSGRRQVYPSPKLDFSGLTQVPPDDPQ